jgi:hypothetical protein
MLEMLPRDKHSSLFAIFVRDMEKSFITLMTFVNVEKTFFFVDEDDK